MTQPIAIVVAAVVIAATAVFLLRWDVRFQASAAVRLDRWTGAINLCLPDDSGVLHCSPPKLDVQGLTPLPKP